MLEATFKKDLRDFTLDVESLVVNDGETLGLIGSNGAGKSTVLKIIAGLMKPDSGRITLDGKVLNDTCSSVGTLACVGKLARVGTGACKLARESIGKRVCLAPEERNIGYMFQSYALFPHMTAKENIAYGLKMQHMAKSDIASRVDELTSALGIADIADEPVTKMSGGQRQRTALARALAPRPSMLLLDEPLSALDSKTQEKLRREIASVIRLEGISCILVTHAISDALTIADTLSVIDKGRIIATGTPESIVHDPRYGFVTADNPNQFRGEVFVKENGVLLVCVGPVAFRAVTTLSGTVSVSIRPEELILSRERFVSTAINSFEGVITKIESVGNGDGRYVFVDIGIPLAAAVTKQSVERLGLFEGGKVTVTCKATAVQVFV